MVKLFQTTKAKECAKRSFLRCAKLKELRYYFLKPVEMDMISQHPVFYTFTSFKDLEDFALVVIVIVLDNAMDFLTWLLCDIF